MYPDGGNAATQQYNFCMRMFESAMRSTNIPASYIKELMKLRLTFLERTTCLGNSMHAQSFFVCIETKRCLFGLWLQDNTLKSLRRRYVTYLAMKVGNKCDKHLRAVRLDVLETTCQIATGKRVAWVWHCGQQWSPSVSNKAFISQPEEMIQFRPKVLKRMDNLGEVNASGLKTMLRNPQSHRQEIVAQCFF